MWTSPGSRGTAKEVSSVRPSASASLLSSRLRLLPACLLLLGITSGINHARAQSSAQGSPAASSLLSGVIADPSGAVIAGATVMLMLTPVTGTEPQDTARTASAGEFRLQAPPGTYTVVVLAEGFAKFESAPFTVAPSSANLHIPRIRMKLEARVEHIDVPDDAPGTPGDTRGGTAIVLNERDLETMPLDSTAMLGELQALAGGQDAELYVDGFSGVKLPPRANIREIRINQNPFSAQNDVNPINGIIQVTTKPGTGHIHGQFYLYGDDSALNARNPFVPTQPGFYAFASGATLSGPIDRKASCDVSFDQTANRTNSTVVAQILDPGLSQTAFTQALPSPSSSLIFSPRIDLQASSRSTMTVKYIFARNVQTNGGVGQLALASQAFDGSTLSDTVQVSNSQIFGAKVVNDTRFQYIRVRTSQTSQNLAPTILVQGAFTGGGNNLGAFSDHQDRYELQNYLSLAQGAHFLSLGGRLRVARDANRSLAGYNGQFIFSSIAAYQATLVGMQSGATTMQITAAGGWASQFSQVTGNPNASVLLADAGLFMQDDWKLKPRLTLSYGLRFETQNYIADHADWAPRLGFSWGFDAHGKTPTPRFVLHGGAGIFYRRFTSDSALLAERENGIAQQDDVVSSPTFYPLIPTLSSLGAQLAPTVYRISPNFHAPYYIGTSIALDRQLGRFGTASVTYLSNRGVHTQLTENINAPLPGTYTPANPASGVRPYGGTQNIYDFVSEGVFRSNRLSANFTVRAGTRFSLFGFYMLRFDKSDADSSGGSLSGTAASASNTGAAATSSAFPSNQYNLGADYGRSSGDIRHTATLGGNTNLPYGIHASGFVRALSGAPFNIVLGQDLNGDTQFNDRPAFATDLTRSSVVTTQWGAFDTNPTAAQTIIPRNLGQGPALFLVDLAAGKSFGVGPRLAATAASAPKSPPEHRYTLDFWVEAQNLLNHNNYASPVGTLNSPLFGHSIAQTGLSSLSPDRVVDLQMSLRF